MSSRRLLLMVAVICLLTGCSSTDDRPRQRSGPSDPEELRKSASRPDSRSRDPADWHVRVELTSAELDEQTISRAGIDWSISGGNVQASGGSPPLSPNGLRIGVAGEHVDVTAFAGRSDRTTRMNTSQFITTLNNHPALLRLTREDVRQLPGDVVVYGPNGHTVLNRYTVRVTGVQLQVTPEIIDRGPYVRLTLTPVMARADGDSVVVRELETTVRVRSGQSVVLASSDRSRRTVGGTLFSRFSSRRSSDFAWVVTPDIIQ